MAVAIAVAEEVAAVRGKAAGPRAVGMIPAIDVQAAFWKLGLPGALLREEIPELRGCIRGPREPACWENMSYLEIPSLLSTDPFR